MKKELYNNFYLKIINEREKSKKQVLCFIVNYFDEYPKSNIKMIDNFLLLIINNITYIILVVECFQKIM
jgi:hypothetical protein